MPDFAHISVMLEEVLRNLNPVSGGRYLDVTVGGGGHAQAILSASPPNGYVVGCDQDGAALDAARQRLASFAGRFELHRINFAEAKMRLSPEPFDGILMDLGVSSAQLDQAERGFSFQKDGPLDMRMDCRQETTAETIINEASMEDLVHIFKEYGEERKAKPLARLILETRSVTPIRSTRQFLSVIESLLPRHGKRIHPATRIFQAVRIAVNKELDVLKHSLADLWSMLKPGGRLLVISFHSLEDRLVKNFARQLSLDYSVVGDVDRPEFRIPRSPYLLRVTRKPLIPSAEEIATNPRSRSAKLRVMEKMNHG